MEFEWDPRKAALNYRKHGVRFADAVEVFYDDAALTIAEEDADDERFLTMGRDLIGRVLIVVYEWREDGVRLISARTATRRERRDYENV